MLDRRELEDIVRELVADAADISAEGVGLDDNIYAKLAVDSLGAVSVFVSLAHTFGIERPADDAAYARLDTCRKIVDYVLAAG